MAAGGFGPRESELCKIICKVFGKVTCQREGCSCKTHPPGIMKEKADALKIEAALLQQRKLHELGGMSQDQRVATPGDPVHMPAYRLRTSCKALVQRKVTTTQKWLSKEAGKLATVEEQYNKQVKLLWEWELAQEFYTLQAIYQQEVTARIRGQHGEGPVLSEQLKRERKFEQYKQSAVVQCYSALYQKERLRGEFMEKERRVGALKRMLKDLEDDAEEQVVHLERAIAGGLDVDAAMRATGMRCKCEDPSCFISSSCARCRCKSYPDIWTFLSSL